MFLTHPLRHVWGGAILLLAVFCAMSQAAHAQSKRFSFDELVAKSDQIFVATCTERVSDFQNGAIVTRYKLKPKEFWKGSARMNKSGEIEYEEIGGQVDGPVPLGTTVPGMADFGVGEELLLFTRNPTDYAKSGKPRGRVILKPSTLRIVGRDQGRFSVFRHPESGAELVGRRAPTGLQAIVQEHAQKKAQERIAAMRAQGVTATDNGETTSSQLNRIAKEEVDSLSRPLGNRFDKAQQSAKAARDAEAKRNPKRADDIFSFESLDSVKARVQKSLQPAS